MECFCLNIARKCEFACFFTLFPIFAGLKSRMSSLQIKMYVVYKQTWSTYSCLCLIQQVKRLCFRSCYQDEPCVIEIQNNMSSDFLTFNRAESISMRLKAENAELKTNMQLMTYLESCQSLIEENISKMQKNIKKIKAYYKFVVQQKNNVNK
ncbi:Hypothetical_protein [Hexamita inflata]|uniref:Hypothetical_protein n=1 Tax=Hexamita inflata TaxID=28002 RepID=A0AA86TXX6_9EUKA|nr:Hypothetical protein HINF_LOCUS20161 [Hexamita inflata]